MCDADAEEIHIQTETQFAASNSNSHRNKYEKMIAKIKENGDENI